MQGFEMGFFALALLAVLFVLWPLRTLIFKGSVISGSGVDRAQENLVLYQDHLKELDASLNDGRIDSLQYQALKAELDRNILDEVPVEQKTLGNKPGPARRLLVGIFLVVAVLVPLSSFFLYEHLGAADAVVIKSLEEDMHRLGNQVVAAEREGAANAGELRRRLAVVQAEYIDRLQGYLQGNPDDVQNWYLLARSFMAMNDFAGAASAYQQILRYEPDAVQIMAELAQAQFLANGNRMNPGIETLAKRVVDLDGTNTTALGLAGIAAFEGQNYEGAVSYWDRAVKLMGPSSPGAMALKSGIERARVLMAESGSVVAADGASGSGDGSEALPEQASINVHVALANSVNASPTDTVFIYARAWNGPKMPLAIAKMTVQDLPVTVTLTEGMAMMPSMTIKSFPELELVARISEAGSPAAKPGDWQASAGPVQLTELVGPVNLTISTQVQ